MTKNRYRMLVIASLILLLISSKIDLALDLLPHQHRQIHPRLIEKEMAILMAFIAIGCVAGFYGCMRFRPWAPALNLITGACVLLYIAGNHWLSIESSWAQVLDFLANASAGMVLMLPYFNDKVRRMFWPETD